MRMQWIPMLLFLAANVALDVAIFRKLRRGRRLPAVKAWSFLSLSAVLLAVIVVILLSLSRGVSDSSFHYIMLGLYAYFAFYLPRYIAGLLWLPGLFAKKGGKVRHWWTHFASAVGIGLFAMLLWGYFVTPYTTNVERVTLEYEGLPAEFDGYRIVHISDLHLGTYNGDTTFVAKCVREINSLKPDAVCFTGDLVNRQTNEAKPFASTLKRLKAKDGVFAVLGNHDYDDYMNWPTEQEKQADRRALQSLESGDAGWRLLMDEAELVQRDEASIAIVGMQNVGDPPFTVYGDLKKACTGLSDSTFKVLLQHNPWDWRHEVLGKTNIQLMLAGHTHAMQMMFTIFGRKYSPAAWRYSEWGGKYEENGQVLYVNIGLGMVGMPARIGSATPEITLITLKKKR